MIKILQETKTHEWTLVFIQLTNLLVKFNVIKETCYQTKHIELNGFPMIDRLIPPVRPLLQASPQTSASQSQG
jgi:hypothetical protein